VIALIAMTKRDDSDFAGIGQSLGFDLLSAAACKGNP
jgi:hypothetical protein